MKRKLTSTNDREGVDECSLKELASGQRVRKEAPFLLFGRTHLFLSKLFKVEAKEVDQKDLFIPVAMESRRTQQLHQ